MNLSSTPPTRAGDLVRITRLANGDPCLREGDVYLVDEDCDGDAVFFGNGDFALVASVGDRWEIVQEAAA